VRLLAQTRSFFRHRSQGAVPAAGLKREAEKLRTFCEKTVRAMRSSLMDWDQGEREVREAKKRIAEIEAALQGRRARS
jgi:hypothetical protein